MAESAPPLGHKKFEAGHGGGKLATSSPVCPASPDPLASAALLLDRAQSLGVVLTAKDGKLHITGDRIGVELLAPELAACRTELVRLLTPTEAPAPAPDVLLSVEPTPDAPEPRPIPWHHLDADWRKAYAAWQAHRNTCPTCSASERTAATAGTGIRCKLGQRLHTAYEAALD